MLSIAIIARDEERHIGAALESVRPIADEVVVLVDRRTTDNTAEIARAHGARVFEAGFRSHAAQRNRALCHCRGEWVLFLDADERVSPELIASIRAVGLNSLDGAHAPNGYWLPRINFYWGHGLRGGGWYPDHQLRLLRRDRARYDEQRLIHEYAEIDGLTGNLDGHLLHINIESLAELRRKQHGYALQEAQTLYLAGVRARPRNLVLQPIREVARRFWTWHGYRDGWLGLFLAIVMGYYEFVKYAHLKGLEHGV